MVLFLFCMEISTEMPEQWDFYVLFRYLFCSESMSLLAGITFLFNLGYVKVVPAAAISRGLGLFQTTLPSR